jgi:hypothetical protein
MMYTRLFGFNAKAEYGLNTLLFTLGGVIWASISFEDVQTYQIQLKDFGWLFILYLMVMLIRFVQVGLLYPIFSRIGLKSTWREATFLAYGGLRGAVGVALGLQLIRYVMEKSDNYEYRKLTTILQFMGGGVTLLTLSINGTSAGFILTQLGLAKPAGSTDRTKLLFEGMAKDFVNQELIQLSQERRFKHVNFRVLKEHVPFLSTDPSEMARTTRSNQTGGALTRHTSSTNLMGNSNRNGEQFIRVLEATHRAASFRTIDNDVQIQMLVEIRQVFLELLGETYHHQLEVGELDEKEDGGYLFDLLIQSVALAKNAVEHEESPIEDWQYTEMFRGLYNKHPTPNEDGAPSLPIVSPAVKPKKEYSNIVGATAAYLSSMMNNSLTRHHHGGDGDGGDSSIAEHKVTAQNIRFDVLRAICFKEGHEVAETKLQLYSNRLNDMDDENVRQSVQLAVQECLEESRKQTHLAAEMLEKEISKQDLQIILSHYCARILIRRLMTFTERSVEDGLLGKIQARAYLKEMDGRIRTIMVSAQKELVEASRGVGNDVSLLGPLEEDESDNGSGIFPMNHHPHPHHNDHNNDVDDDDSNETEA